ncbi:SARS2 family protein [Megaselia abdita]
MFRGITRHKNFLLNRRFVHHLLKDDPIKHGITSEEMDTLEKYANLRKSVNNIQEIRNLLEKLQFTKSKELSDQLQKELRRLPNKTHPSVMHLQEPKVIETFNKFPEFSSNPEDFDEIAKKLNLIRTNHLGNFCGHKSYYFLGALAQLEHGLIRYALDIIRPKGFKLVTVPDILPPEVIQGCGMQTDGERNQVYKLENGLCLSGTSEMALAGFFKDKILEEEELPIKLTATSRCFRAETSGTHDEKGIYRVHQFTKVEMFSICSENQSDELLEEFKNTEIELFKNIGIHFKLLDMPPNELGAPAYRKYDIESWMPGRNFWGEISSCSNCTDYQAQRLNIKYRTKSGEVKYVHSVNGTACAVPRLLISILETFQKAKGSVEIPEVLRKYMRGQEKIKRQKQLPELKLVKNIHSDLK